MPFSLRIPSPSPYPLVLAAVFTAPLAAQNAPPPVEPEPAKPWRLQDAAGLPSWLRISGDVRIRYETLNDQFRAAAALGDDEDLLLMRTSLRTELVHEPWSAVVELLDARAYGADDSSPLDTSLVNAIDLLQAYAAVDLGEFAGARHRLLVGRETIDLGSRRLVARNNFRNTINAFTGVDWEWRTEATVGRVFWTTPVRRRPSDFASLEDNEPEWDDQDLDLQFGGVHVSHQLAERVHGEAYVFVLDESGATTRQRELVTPGLRVLRAAKTADWNAEIESAVQFGDSKASTSTTAPVLDHFAWTVHVHVGYTFDAPLKPNLRLGYDYASGDSDPGDGDNGRFDTLFGARRFDFGPTDLWGAVARSNVSSPEIRLTLKPSEATEFLVAWRDVHLAAERDSWTAGGVRDASGASGDHVGQHLEARLRWDVMPRSVRLECGGAFLFAESFLDRAPNGSGRDSSYGYLEVSWRF